MTPADRTALPGVGDPAPFPFPPIATDALPNGVRLWTMEQPHAELVTVLLLLRHGSAADPPERAGLADTADVPHGSHAGPDRHQFVRVRGLPG